MGAADPDDQGMEVLHELARSNLIAFPDAIKTASQVKRLVVSHAFIEASSVTFCKTPVAARRLPGPRPLDFPQGPSIEWRREMASASQALRLTSAHDL
jgi:hypothetical protein